MATCIYMSTVFIVLHCMLQVTLKSEQMDHEQLQQQMENEIDQLKDEVTHVHFKIA